MTAALELTRVNIFHTVQLLRCSCLDVQKQGRKWLSKPFSVSTWYDRLQCGRHHLNYWKSETSSSSSCRCRVKETKHQSVHWKKKKRDKSTQCTISPLWVTRRALLLRLPVVTQCFLVNVSSSVLKSLFALIYTEPVWMKHRRQVGFGLCRPALRLEKGSTLSSVTRTQSCRREKTDRSMTLYYIHFRWKGLEAGLHTPVTNTAPFIVTRYPAVTLWW